MDQQKNDTALMHDFKATSSSFFTPKLIGILLIAIVLGVGTGNVIAKGVTGPGSSTDTLKSKDAVEKGKIYGATNASDYKDTTEGLLKVGGIEGEGAYHLERGVGPSQYAYLTSSVVDLSLFVGRKVQVWGQTMQAEHAGWLMDVGRVKVID